MRGVPGSWSLVLVAAALLGGGTSARAADCHFDRTLNVGGTGTLLLNTGSGNLRVVPGDGSHVHIVGHVTGNTGWFGGGSGTDVQQVCNNPPIQQSGNDVRVGPHTGEGLLRHVSIDYFVEVPGNFAVNAGSGSGDVDLRGVRGPVTGTSGSGTVKAQGLPAVVKLESGSGDIAADSIGGNANLQTGSGSIRASFGAPGNITADTGSGDITLSDIAGGLVAHTGSGKVEVSGRPQRRWQISTGSGDVALQVPGGAGFNLDASASSGDIETALPITMQGSIDKHHVRGAVRGGGPDVHIDTGSGGIEVK